MLPCDVPEKVQCALFDTHLPLFFFSFSQTPSFFFKHPVQIVSMWQLSATVGGGDYTEMPRRRNIPTIFS